VFGISKYCELQEVILSYYENNILVDIDSTNLNLIFSQADSNIKNTLFKIAIEKMLSLTNYKKDLNTYIKAVNDVPEQTEPDELDEIVINSNTNSKKSVNKKRL
jgi:hypothetical protein